MNTILPSIALMALTGCTTGEKCPSGVRESFSAAVETSSGPINLTTSQCVAPAWSHERCETGTLGLCEYFFEPHMPAEVPVNMIFGDFVFSHAFHAFDAAATGTGQGPDPELTLTDIAEAYVAEGFRVSPVKRTTMLGGNPAFGLTVSCDHPNIDDICPFTTEYLWVDLDAEAPGLRADFTARYADFVDAGNNSAALPEEFIDYQEMLGTVDLTLE